MSSTALPTFYIPHGGGPCFFMEWPYPTANPWSGLEHFLAELPRTLSQRPRAVLVVSGHWEEQPPALNVQAHPPLLYDYYGFPEHTYHLQYPAPGDPLLAEEVRTLLAAAGLACRAEQRRGLDHGVFVPFKVIYPQADMPLLQLSLLAGLDPAAHLRLGAALAPLRERGVLIVGSGMSFHNLAVRSIDNEPIAPSQLFDEWLNASVCACDPWLRNRELTRWSQAPAARFAHPREEHLLPLMVAAGAAGEHLGERVFSGRMMGWQVSGFRFGAA